MSISTNSIIHYTNTIDILTKILEEGFKITYCTECLFLGNGYSNAAHPMISFCDIPLSDSKQHFEAYGEYGIGLSKQWAISHGINPVLYIDKNSLFALSLLELIEERRKVITNLTDEQKAFILKIKSYAKNYSGLLHRDSKEMENYRYYDEREWRLVPNEEVINNASFSISSKDYLKNKDKYNSKFKDVRIKFNDNDISYIIVKNTSEIPKMIKFLRHTYGSKLTSDNLDVLFSKVCSTEQIKDDY